MRFDEAASDEALLQAKCPHYTADISLLVNKPEGTEFMLCENPVAYNVNGILICEECLNARYKLKRDAT